jgi:hypothetical protein
MATVRPTNPRDGAFADARATVHVSTQGPCAKENILCDGRFSIKVLKAHLIIYLIWWSYRLESNEIENAYYIYH